MDTNDKYYPSSPSGGNDTPASCHSEFVGQTSTTTTTNNNNNNNNDNNNEYVNDNNEEIEAVQDAKLIMEQQHVPTTTTSTTTTAGSSNSTNWRIYPGTKRCVLTSCIVPPPNTILLKTNGNALQAIPINDLIYYDNNNDIIKNKKY